MNLKVGQSYILKKISSQDSLIVQRLHDLGIYEGTEVKLVNIISFGSVYVLRYEDSLVALNTMEMSCLTF